MSPYTIRLSPDGRLDEVTARDVTHAHLEYHADNAVWLRLDRPDGAVVVQLSARGPIEGLAEWEEGTEPAAPAPDVRRLEALAREAREASDALDAATERADARGTVQDYELEATAAEVCTEAAAALGEEARTAVPALIADVRRLRALVAHQNDDVIETRGALAWLQRAVLELAEEMESRPADVPGAVADEIARRLRALVEGR